MTSLIAFGCGLVFGIGLLVSQMVDPARVIGFLDVAGAWDPTLVFVMLGAMVVGFVGFRLAKNRSKPYCGVQFEGQRRNDWDMRLLIGAAIFGIGWGLAGICPGPAIVALTSLKKEIAQFFIAMLIGMVAYERVVDPILERRSRKGHVDE